ncbi:MAG: hypothetical protein NC187_08315 [Candidatus Amulumruptor caecigallinarius]|nr:hypothetical protein [Candidatus Amulumruptor caecigallinarius]MCM1397473.1 hypothetical protein [Candidatus Amulumruptor caecigallinarius]MCM1454320.1 hypothetical protein [bacterium]
MTHLFPLDNLIPEIVAPSNMCSGYDYVIRHLESTEQRAHYAPDSVPLQPCDFDTAEEYAHYVRRQEKAAALREVIIQTLTAEISNGTFRITMDDVKTILVTDGPKQRECQSPKVVKRIGCHCIMVIVEKYVYPTLIHNTAASIKGRGMHWLHHIIEADIKAAPEKFQYYYQNDIHHYYDSISQERMKAVIREYISDPVLLPILDCFICLLPQGLSKGLRSSQTFGNLYCSPVHRKMLEYVERYKLTKDDGSEEMRHLYYNYCDDTAFAAPDKKTLWRLRDIYIAEMAKLGLTVKPNEAVRPLTEGLDMVGYIHYPTHSLIRKRTKQNAARKLAKVKSRKRRQSIIGSFKGMACHADCKHLYFTLTHHRMQKFSEMGITYKPADGKKRFPGKVMRLSAIQNMPIEIHDYESDLTTSHGDDRYLVSFRIIQSKEWGKFFTSSEEMKNILDQISDREDGFPFECTIISEVFDGNKVKYKFS